MQMDTQSEQSEQIFRLPPPRPSSLDSYRTSLKRPPLYQRFPSSTENCFGAPLRNLSAPSSQTLLPLETIVFNHNVPRLRALPVINVWTQRCPVGCPYGPWDHQNGVPGYPNALPGCQNGVHRPPKSVLCDSRQSLVNWSPGCIL